MSGNPRVSPEHLHTLLSDYCRGLWTEQIGKGKGQKLITCFVDGRSEGGYSI